MAVNFRHVDEIAATVADLYAEAELSLVRRISRQLAQGVDAPGWATAKLSAVSALRDAARVVVAGLTFGVSETLRAGVRAAFRNGWGDALSGIASAFAPRSGIGDRARAARRTVPGTGAVEALAASVVRDLRPAHAAITRQTVDAYRGTIAAASARVLTGAQTRREASQAAWSGLAGRGLLHFDDQSGRRWHLSSYAEMATRTVTARAAEQGHIDALTNIDVGLIYIGDVVQECALCRPFEGRVLTLAGPTGLVTVPHILTGDPVTVDVMATLAEARARGLHHPNCRHGISAYLPGVTRVPVGRPDPEGDKARQQQRYLERRIRAAKLQEAAALSEPVRKAARARVRAEQARLREHLAAHPTLKRLPYREQIGGGNIPPAGRSDAAGAVGPDVQPTLDGGTGTPPPAPDQDTDQPEQAPPPPAQTGPDLFDAARLSRLDRLDDQQLADLFADLSARDTVDADALRDVLAEMDRREAAPEQADPLADVDLSALLDGELFAAWQQHSDQLATVERIEAELIRRDRERGELLDVDDDQADRDPAALETLAALDADLDRQAALNAEQDARDREAREQAERDARIDALVARGSDYIDAYAEVYGLDPEQLRREERAAQVDTERRAGETREQAVRRLYTEWVHLQYLAAEEDTRGNLLNRRTQGENARRERRGEFTIDPVSLFTGPAHVARARASEDLLRWWVDNPRMTYDEFKADLFGDAGARAKAEQARLRGNNRDFGL